MDPTDLDHIRLAELFDEQTRIGARDIAARSVASAARAFNDTGLLKLAYSEDLANRRSALAWYSPLESALAQSGTVWKSEVDTDAAGGVFGDLTRNAAVFLAEAGRLKVSPPRRRLALSHRRE